MSDVLADGLSALTPSSAGLADAEGPEHQESNDDHAIALRKKKLYSDFWALPLQQSLAELLQLLPNSEVALSRARR